MIVRRKSDGATVSCRWDVLPPWCSWGDSGPHLCVHGRWLPVAPDPWGQEFDILSCTRAEMDAMATATEYALSYAPDFELALLARRCTGLQAHHPRRR